jgi:energy-converting hydrogenase Eha subunit H
MGFVPYGEMLFHPALFHLHLFMKISILHITMLTKHDRELAIQLFKNCIKHKQNQKIMKLVHMS